jgi:hypothetical protein
MLSISLAMAADNPKKYLITSEGIDIFLIGQKIPTKSAGYSISQSILTKSEEGEEYEIPVYTVSENGQDILNIEATNDIEIASDIFVLSGKFKTAKNIGLGSTIEEFMAAYPDFTIWFSYISDWYVIETKQLKNVQFFLAGDDFIEEGGPEFDSDVEILKPSEFKKGSTIKEIRIWGW